MTHSSKSRLKIFLILALFAASVFFIASPSAKALCDDDQCYSYQYEYQYEYQTPYEYEYQYEYQTPQNVSQDVINTYQTPETYPTPYQTPETYPTPYQTPDTYQTPVSNESQIVVQATTVNFSGRIVDSRTGNGVSGASLLLVADDRSNPSHGTRATSDGNGSFSFSGINSGSFNFEVRGPSGYNGVDVHVDLNSNASIDVALDSTTPTSTTPTTPTSPTTPPTQTTTTATGAQNIQYTITGPTGVYSVKNSGHAILTWTVNVISFTGPSTMHIRTMGQWSPISGDAPTIENPFAIPTSGKLDFRNPPESGTFTFSFDTRHATCGRAQIDGSFIDDRTGSDANLFLGMIVDYGVDCSPAVPVTTVAPSAPAAPVTTTAPSAPVSPTTCQDSTANNFGGALPCTYTTPPAPTGSVTFCLILADVNNVIATSSAGLPAGVFSMNLNNSSGQIQSKTWTTASYAPNQRHILSNQNDSDCVTYSNLPIGNYSYSQLSVLGALWRTPKYNDNQTIQPITSTSSFSLYAASTISDGLISITPTNLNPKVVVYEYDDPGLSCPAPQINSPFSLTTTVGVPFTYTITASSTTATTFSASGLPAGLTFNSSTNTISGTPTSSGTFNIQLFAVNTCVGGLDSKVLVLNVTTTPAPGANLAVSKTSNRTSANVGDSVTYTVRVVNNGPDQATNAFATDVIPAGIELTSYNTTQGTYNPSTGLWAIGTLNNGTSTVLTITGNVRNGYQGQTITNSVNVSASQPDANLADNTASVNVNVVVPGCTSNCGGGGGGGGGVLLPISDLSVSKTSNRGTANVGDLITYTIRITNHGPANASDVTAVDALPLALSFVSASTTSGSFNSSSGMWFAGSLSNGSSTTLTITARVKDGYQGQLIRNIVNVYAAQTDNNPGNNTAYVDVNGTFATTPTPTSCYYLYDYLRKDFNNNPVEVRKLQIFLRDLEGFTNIQITGVYDDQTIHYLNAFQARYASDILTPWGHTAPTGYTYILTKKKVNEIYCRMAFPVTPLQQQEIDNYRNFLLSLKNNGISFPNTGIEPASIVVPAGTTTPPVFYGEVGAVSTTTDSTGVMSRFTANVYYIWDTVASWFEGFCHWLNWLLLIIIAIISYFWYKERENNKKIDQINKDLLLK